MSEQPFKGSEPKAEPVTPPAHPKLGKADDVYVYERADGTPLFYVCRFTTPDPEKGKDRKTFLQGRPHGKRWQWKLGNLEPVLYGLPELHAHLTGGDRGPIYVTEGEKNAKRLRAHLKKHKLPGVVTTAPMGTHKWRDSYTETLRGARLVILIADNDEPGHTGALKAAEELAPHVTEARVLRSPLEHEHADIDDHLDAGLDLNKLIALKPPTPAGEGPVFLDAYEFVEQQEEPPAILWGTDKHPILAEGLLAILAGRPEAGKTTFVIDLACHLACGLPYPPGDSANERAPTPYPVHRPLRIALIENEGPRELFRDRLRQKLDIFPHNITERGGYLGIQVWRWGAFSFADDDAFAKAAAELDELRIDLVIGDPLNMLGAEGVGSPDDTRGFVQRLRRIGMGTTRAFLLIHHFRERVEHHEDDMRKLSGAWSTHLDSLLGLAVTGSDDQVRLAFGKLRWARAPKPNPIILGKVYNALAFEALGEEDDTAILEPVLVEGLEGLRYAKGGYKDRGWTTANSLADRVSRGRKPVRLCLEAAPHIFALRTGEDARELGARGTAKLYGLRTWDDAPAEQRSLTADEAPDTPAESFDDGDIPW